MADPEDTAIQTTAEPDQAARAPAGPPAQPESCPQRRVTPLAEFIDNLPYLAMVLSGAAVFLLGGRGPAAWLAAAVYLAYGAAGALWVILFICPHCDFYDTRLCPCGYGRIAAKLRSRKDGGDFARQFRRHIPVIVPLWIIPLIAGGAFLWVNFSWPLLALLVGFAVNSFLVLPLVSRRFGCQGCPQKAACPWMGRKCR